MKQIISLISFLFITTLSFSQDTTTVYFDFDKYELTPEGTRVLDQIISKSNLFSAAIYGHTDQLGSNEYNDRLSLKRADAVKNYLLHKGVSAEKITTVKGFGKTMPAINQLDKHSRKFNRRVTIIANFEMTARDSSVIDEKTKPGAIQPKIQPPSTNNSPARKIIKENLIKEVTDSTTKAGDNIVLKNINFYGGRHVFLPEAYTPLNELLYVMKTVPTLEIEIQGHICCQAGDGDGLDIDTGEPFLSYNRARAVYEYLIDNGIDRTRLRYKGYGHKFPLIAFEQTEDERTTNRRVEIKILKK